MPSDLLSSEKVMDPSRITRRKARSQLVHKEHNQINIESQQVDENMPQHTMDSLDTTSSSSSKRTRGPTMKKDIYDMPPGRHIKIEFDALDRPIGHYAEQFAHFIGSVARNGKLLPIDIHDWRYMKEENIRECIELITSKFEFNPHCEKFVVASLANKWKDHKERLKRHYFKSHGEGTCPNNFVEEEQWKKLVRYWKSEQAQKVSQINKQNRAKQQMISTTRPKSIAKRQHDYEKKMGEKMSLLQTFKMMYTKKNGDPVNSVVAEKFVEIENMMACRSKNETEGENSNEGEILTQVLGKVDTTKPMCYGSFITSGDIYGPRTKCRWSEHQESEKVDQMEKEFVSMKSKMLEMEENYKEKMHEMEKLYKHLQEQLHDVLNAKGQHAANGGKDSGNDVFPSTNEHSSAGSHVLLSHERDADEAAGRPLHGGEQEDGVGLPRPSVVGVRLRLPPHGLQTKKKVKKNSAPRTNGCAGQKNVSSYKTVLPNAIAPQQNHSNDAQAICLLGFNFERVAEGKIISKDPKKQLGAQLLGDEYYEVQVTKVLKPYMRLPTDWNKMLGQCEGDCIPWMKSFVLEDKCEESLT